MVDGAELLVALPGDVDLVARVAGVQAAGDLGLLLLGEVFHAVAEQPADLVQRVVLVAAAAQRVLLHAAADFVDDLGAEPDHVEGIEDRDRVRKLVMDGVRVAAERVESGLLDAVEEPVGLGLQPGLVDGAGAADDGVQQPGVKASGLVTGQIDHDRDGSIDADPRRPPVGSGRGAVDGIAAACVSPGRPPNPACDFSPHRALHVSWLWSAGTAGFGVHGVGMR